MYFERSKTLELSIGIVVSVIGLRVSSTLPEIFHSCFQFSDELLIFFNTFPGLSMVIRQIFLVPSSLRQQGG